jgi:glyoxylase-like metal-dependent hydrolase (beta-lactamase superfamily II)
MVTRPLPPTEEVRPGIWAFPIPMPGPLVYVWVYALEAPDGLLLIDAGLDDDGAFEALAGRLDELGRGLEDVRGVLFTHGHIDHYGLAARVRGASGAWTALHERDANHPPLAGRAEAFEAWVRRAGLEPDEVAALRTAAGRFITANPPPPERNVAEGDRIPLARGELVALHTPGHAGGHVCYLHEDAGIVFTGDHVLSETTPNVSVSPFTDGSPLDEYLESLRRVAELGPLLALPGHEEQVQLDTRARELLAHHDEQLANAEAIVAAGHETAREVAERMTWSKPWSTLGPLDVYLAVGETLAHLIVLERRGVLARDPGEPERWRLGATSPRA